jgi:hypothetical protein
LTRRTSHKRKRREKETIRDRAPIVLHKLVKMEIQRTVYLILDVDGDIIARELVTSTDTEVEYGSDAG